MRHNEEARAGTGEYKERGPIGYDTTDPVTVTHELKTVALQQVMADHQWDALITGIRRDEDPTRAKERYFSPRNKDFEWDYKDQPPEFWNQFTTSCAPGEHVRVQALLDWTERDIWDYIWQEDIPLVPLYFAKPRPVVRRQGAWIMVDDERMPLEPGERPELRSVRFRSIGCYPYTGAIESTATSLAEIVIEMRESRFSERQGRLIDHDQPGSMERKKQEGYF